MQQKQTSGEAPEREQEPEADREVALRLVQAREMRNRSQEDFAALMGVSRSAYQRYEAGTRSPKLRHLQGLAKVGVNIHWLLTGEDEAALQSAYAAGTPNPDHLREPARPTSLDGDLMGRIVDTIRAVYKAEGQAIPDRSLGELAAEWYGTITSQAAGPGDRLDALAEHQIALRRRLRAATTHPTSDKRPA